MHRTLVVQMKSIYLFVVLITIIVLFMKFQFYRYKMDFGALSNDSTPDKNGNFGTSANSIESPELSDASKLKLMPRKREHSEEENDESDDLVSFFKSMEKTTRKLTPDLRLKVKRMVSDIVFDAEERWLRDQNIIINN